MQHSVTPGVDAAVPVPLCMRSAEHEAGLDAVLKWKRCMAERIAEIGDRFQLHDDGPTGGELLRELTWVLEDAVAESCEQANTSSSNEGRWTECQWRQLEVMAQGRDPRNWRLRLRLPVEQLYELWHRRLEDREPFQYLIASAHWRNHVLAVSPGVLIPRPETEIMPELAASAMDARPALAGMPWADLGTGSGAIAIATAEALVARSKGTTDPRVWAVDLSTVAAAHARANAARAGVAATVRIVEGSWCDPLVTLRGRLGGLLSNPPYIPRVEMPGLQREVGRHEPASALDGGPGEGLDSLAVICADAVHMLAPGGYLALETAGHEQAHRVADMLRALSSVQPPGSAALRAAVAAAGNTVGVGGAPSPEDAFQDVQVLDDCYGVPRFVTAVRRGL